MMVNVVRVFVDKREQHGNPLGIVFDANGIDDEEKQQLAYDLGYSETVFVEDEVNAQVRIFSQEREIPFAGHPMVGVAWILGRRLGHHPGVLRTEHGKAESWVDDGNVWVRAALGTTPPWWHERLNSASQVAELRGPLAEDQDATQLWAWEDEEEGRVRARTFAARFGIVEDEATGSAAMRLAAALGRSLTITHGNGSTVLAKPGPPGTADVGGRVVEDEPRQI